MIEDSSDSGIHVIVSSPPSSFEASLLLRTLYVSFGAENWYLYVVGLSSRLRAKTIVNSRVPIELANTRLEFLEETNLEKLIEKIRGATIYSLNPLSGKSISEVEALGRIAVVVDYKGHVSKLLKGEEIRIMGYPLAYEAVVFLHLLSKRARKKRVEIRDLRVEDPRLYLALHARLESSLSLFDNYAVIEPNTLIYALSRLLAKKRVVAEPRRTVVEIDHREGEVIQEIIVDFYSYPSLERIGGGKIAIRANKVSVEFPWNERYVYFIDRECLKIRLASSS